jgi:nucleotide-binding universal stress UspA family protein
MKPSSTFHPSRILCPVDFSDLSGLALKYAAAGARAFDAALVVFHAHRLELPAYFTKDQVAGLTRQRRGAQNQALKFLQSYTRKILGAEAGRIRLRFETKDAHPVDAILAAARRHRADLIVMGTHGRGGARRLWLGSVTENIARQSGIPVFVARQKQHEFINTADPQTMPQLATILCPMNFSQASRAALGHAAALARQFNARLVAPCIVEPGDKGAPPAARRELERWLEAAGGQCATQVLTRKGQAAGEIVSLASRMRADLVVLGAQRRGSMRTWLWGDTTEIVLRQAAVPVLVVPR